MNDSIQHCAAVALLKYVLFVRSLSEWLSLSPICAAFAQSVRPFPAFSALALDGAAAAVAEEGGRRQSEQTERRGLSAAAAAALGLPQISS